MKTLYLDCFCGIAGDMLLGALLDAGADAAHLQSQLATLPCADEWSLSIQSFCRMGVGGTNFDVILFEHEHHHEHEQDHAHHHHRLGYSAIANVIQASGLSAAVKQRACAVFHALAVVEAQVHQSSVEDVHFHEVGAVDAIVDICGACIALEQLGIERVICSPVNLGGGQVTCAHGVLPVPAPATALLMRDIPSYTDLPSMGELTTPTGAALVKTIAAQFGTMPTMCIRSVGYGFGKRENGTLNALRVLIGEQAQDVSEGKPLVLLQTNLDDMTGEGIGFACEQMMQSGALDCYVQPIIAKKGRPGAVLCVMCAQEEEARFTQLLFLHTSTLGVRRFACTRSELQRSVRQAKTPYGDIPVKCAQREDGSLWRQKPEYEACAAVARKHGCSLQEVQRSALLDGSVQETRL